MRTAKLIGFVAVALLVARAAFADEVTVARDVRGPEGPLFVDGHLYFVGWASDTLSRLDGDKVTVLNHTPGCSHNGLAFTRRRTFLIACDDEHGAIIETDMAGRQLRRWDTDSRGRRLEGGINDIVVTGKDGAYATLSGPFVDPPKAIVGKIFYLPAGGRQWTEVADDLNYANGIAVSPDQKTLYVNETVGNCILKFTINADGTLSHRANFALLNLLVKNKVESWWIGPDSMKVDSTGNIYVAQLYGGKILKLSSQGRLLHVFEIAAGDGTTNVAFGEGEKDLYVTAVKDLKDPQAPGSIVKIRNFP
jgi:gluconolactonase